MSTHFVVDTYIVKIKLGTKKPFPSVLKERFPNLTHEDILCDLEDEIVTKATGKYHRDRDLGKHQGDEQAYTFHIHMIEPPAIDNRAFAAYTTPAVAASSLGTAIVTVFGSTGRQ